MFYAAVPEDSWRTLRYTIGRLWRASIIRKAQEEGKVPPEEPKKAKKATTIKKKKTTACSKEERNKICNYKGSIN